MSDERRVISLLLADIASLEQQRDLMNVRIQTLRNELLYLQRLQWTRRTGLKIGDELAATSSFMKEIDRRRGAGGGFHLWNWEAAYFLNGVDLGKETTYTVLCNQGGGTGNLPEWVILEMREKYLQLHSQPAAE